jgi:hypothetical protein
MDKYGIFISCFIFATLSICINGYSIGLSPDRLYFDENEKELFLFNPNNVDVNYSIEGCEGDFIELIRKGVVKGNSRRTIIIRHNPATTKDKTECNIDIYFSNNLYSTGFSVGLEFNTKSSKSINNQILSGVFGETHDENHDENKDKGSEEKKSKLHMIIGAVIFIIALAAILIFF